MAKRRRRKSKQLMVNPIEQVLHDLLGEAQQTIATSLRGLIKPMTDNLFGHIDTPMYSNVETPSVLQGHKGPIQFDGPLFVKNPRTDRMEEIPRIKDAEFTIIKEKKP